MSSMYVSFSALIVLLYLFIGFTDPSTKAFNGDLVYLIAPLVTLFISFYAVKVFGISRRSTSLLWLAIGILFLCFGETSIFYYKHVENLSSASPTFSIADIYQLLAFPCFFIGIYIENLLNKKQDQDLLKLFKKPLFYIVLLGLGAIIYLSLKQTHFVDIHVTNSLFSGGFGLFALILAASSFFVFFEYKGGILSSSWKFLGLGLVFALLGYLGQIVFDIGPFDPNSLTRILTNFLFLIGYLLAGYGMLRFSEVPREMQKRADNLLLSLKKRKEN